MPSTPEVLKVKVRPAAGAHSLDVQVFPEAASQTFKRGDLLGLTSGKVRCNVTAGAGNDLTSAGDEVVGIALKDASGTTDADVPVLLVSNLEICLPANHNTAASGITAIADVGGTFTLERTVAGGWTVCVDTTSNPVAEVVAIDPTYAVGTQHGWYWVRIIAAERAVAA